VTTTIAEDVAMMEGQLRTTEERLANTEEVLRIAQAHNKDLATELERVRHEHAQDMAQMQQEHTIAVQRAAQVSGLIRSMARQALEGIEMMRGNDFVPRPEQVVRVESAPARENLSAATVQVRIGGTTYQPEDPRLPRVDLGADPLPKFLQGPRDEAEEALIALSEYAPRH
jgi:predicted TIM-barrel enzyme